MEVPTFFNKKTFEFFPQGRVYYSKRTQPPLLTSMVHEYYKHTGDKDFLAKAMPVLVTVRSHSIHFNFRAQSLKYDMSNFTQNFLIPPKFLVEVFCMINGRTFS
jgi:neutral trehalase